MKLSELWLKPRNGKGKQDDQFGCIEIKKKYCMGEEKSKDHHE